MAELGRISGGKGGGGGGGARQQGTPALAEPLFREQSNNGKCQSVGRLRFIRKFIKTGIIFFFLKGGTERKTNPLGSATAIAYCYDRGIVKHLFIH